MTVVIFAAYAGMIWRILHPALALYYQWFMIILVGLI